MSKTLKLGDNALVYCAGDKADRIFLLRTGRITLSYADIETGKETADVVTPGEFFGINAVLGRFPREENAIAKEHATALAFTPAEFEQLLMSNDRIIMKMLKVFSDQLRRVHARVSKITKTPHDVKADLALFEIGEKYMARMRFAHAKYIFARYVELYPSGENANVAAERLKTLANASPHEDQSRLFAGTAQKAPSHDDDSILQMEIAFLGRFSRAFKPGEIIFSEYEPGSTFYLVRSGAVKLVKSTGQSEYTIDVLRQSEMFGEMAILDKSPRTASAIAIDNVTLLEFNEENFEILMRGNPKIAIKLLKVFSTRIHRAKRRVTILALPDPLTRVADVFLMLDENRVSVDGKTGFYSREFTVNMEDIAHWAGLPIGKTKTVLDFLASQHRIKVNKGSVDVKNINDFSRIVAASRRAASV